MGYQLIFRNMRSPEAPGPRKAMADQIATVSKQRLRSRAGTLSLDDIRAVEGAIRVQLGLSPS